MGEEKNICLIYIFSILRFPVLLPIVEVRRTYIWNVVTKEGKLQ